MNIDLLTASITKHEGSKSFVYDDATGQPIVSGYTVKGNPTIGIGRLLTFAKGLSDGEQTYLLSNDLQFFIREAEAQPWWLAVSNNDARARAMVETLFNLGIARLSGFVHALAYLQQNQFADSANEFRNSAWYHQVGSEEGERGFVLTYMIEHGEDYVP